MIQLSIHKACKPEFVVRRLHDLGHHLGDVSGRVRVAIVDAVRATVADMARDAVDRVLSRRVGDQSVPMRYERRRDEYDPWDDSDPDERYDPDDDYEPDPTPSAESNKPLPGCKCAVAIALAAAGWWLRQQGTLLGALGIALAAAAAAALTGQLAWGGVPLVEAASELLNLQRCLSLLATLLAGV